jgi:DNA-binding winged helix-turn-helix (wHTH) protein
MENFSKKMLILELLMQMILFVNTVQQLINLLKKNLKKEESLLNMDLS